jgi:hypothetical protein
MELKHNYFIILVAISYWKVHLFFIKLRKYFLNF